MKKIIILLVSLFIANFAYGESYLLIDKTTKEVKSLSPEDDAQLEKGWEKIILSEEFKDIELQYHPTYYKYKNNRFIVNTQKISDEAIAQEKAEKRAEQEALIQERMRKIAKDQLIAEGVIFEDD